MEIIKKIFTLCLVLSPILSMYGIYNGSSITILDVLLVLLLSIIIIINIKKREIKIKNIYSEMLPYFYYIIVNFCVISILSFTSIQTIDIGMRTLRYCIYLIVITFFVKEYFDYKFGIKVFKFLVIFATIYFFLQLILLRNFNFYLRGYVEFLPVLRENLVTFSETATYTPYTRVRSIFGEISQFSICLCGYLCISMFKKNDFEERKTQIFLTLGLLLSVSSIGVLSIISLWIIWIIIKSIQMKDKINIKILGLIISIIILLIIFIGVSESFNKFIGRLGTSSYNRFGAYEDYYNYIKNKPLVNLLFGTGMDLSSFKVWYPSFAKILRFFGITGIILFIYSILRTYMTIKEESPKIILLGYLIFLGFGTEVLVGNFLLLYYPFIIKKFEWDDY